MTRVLNSPGCCWESQTGINNNQSFFRILLEELQEGRLRCIEVRFGKLLMFVDIDIDSLRFPAFEVARSG